MQEPTGSGERDEAVLFLDMISTIVKHRKLVLVATAVAAVGSLAFSIGSLLLPPEKSYLPNFYKPEAIVLVSTNSGGGLSSMLGDATGLAILAGMNVSGGKSNGQLAVLIASSNSTIDELDAEFDFQKRYKIKKNPKSSMRKAFLKHYDVTYDDKTSALSISFEDYDPGYARSVVNSAVEILDRRFATLGGSKALAEKDRLEGKLTEVKSQIDILEGKAKAFTAKYGVISVEAMATEQVTLLARLRSELILRDMEIENYVKFTTIEDPVVRRLRSERAGISSKLEELERGNSVLPSQRDIPKLAFEYAALQRDLAVQMEIFKFLTQQYEMAKLNSENLEPVLQVFELAEVPDMKSKPSRAWLCIVVTLIGAAGAILLAFAIDFLRRIRNDPVLMGKLRDGT